MKRSLPPLLLAAGLLSACAPAVDLVVTDADALEATAPGTWKALLVAGDNSAEVFDNGMAAMADELASRGVSEVIRLTSDSSLDLPEATEDGIKDALLSLEVGHDDQCLVYLTSHGSEDGLYLASEDRLLSPGALAGLVDDGCGDQPTL